MDSPFIVTHLLSGFMIQYKLLAGIRREQMFSDILKAKYTQDLHLWMNGKLEAMQACLQCLLHKIVKYPMSSGVCLAFHRCKALSNEKLSSQNFVIKSLWFFMIMIPNLPKFVQGALEFYRKNAESKRLFCEYSTCVSQFILSVTRIAKV